MTAYARPAYTGPRSRFTIADGTYYLGVSFPVAGRTFLFDDTEAGPGAEFRRVFPEGRDSTGFVGYSEGHKGSVFHFSAKFTADTDEAAVETLDRVLAAIPDAVVGWVDYMTPTEFGGTSERILLRRVPCAECGVEGGHHPRCPDRRL